LFQTTFSSEIMKNAVRPLQYKQSAMGKQNSRIRHIQLSLDSARRPMGHGGWRPGAGRPRTRRGVSHETRPPIARTIPQHVTLRTEEDVPSLRTWKIAKVIRKAIADSHKPEFRVTDFNIESNHLHLIIEAGSNEDRAAGITGLKVRIARRLNRFFGRSGALFEERYHTRPLRTPREVRNAIRYVLNNALHHGAAPQERDATWIDPYSSAPWFDGWRERVEPDTWWKHALLDEPSPVARPTVWLLAVGWRRHGRIAFDEVPGKRSQEPRTEPHIR
jgi:REP element-mobilizing transposase RayT